MGNNKANRNSVDTKGAGKNNDASRRRRNINDDDGSLEDSLIGVLGTYYGLACSGLPLSYGQITAATRIIYNLNRRSRRHHRRH